MNPLYLLINHVSGYIGKKGVNKYLVFDSTDENKELLKKYNDVFNGIRDKIKEICSDECDYEKDYMKIKFNSDDNLPLNKPLKFHNMTITIRSVFEEDGKLYFLDDALYELNLQIFLSCIKMSEIADLTYYQRNKDVILNKAKDFYKNNKERLREQARHGYRNVSEDEKNKKREYGEIIYRSISEEKKQRQKKKICKTKKFSI